MSLSSSGNQGYLDITNAILRVGTLDVHGITGVDMVTNVVKQNAVLVWDDQGADMSTPPFQLGAGVTRSTSPPEIDLRNTDGNNFMYHGLKLPNQWMAQFDLYLDTGTTGNVHLQMYTSSTTTYDDDGYQFIFDAANSTLTLEYDGAQVQQESVTYATGWQTFVVSFNRGAWGVARESTVVFTLDDDERSAVYDNTSGQYLRFETDATTSRKVRYLKFTNSGPWLQSNTGGISFLTGNVSVGHHDTTHKFSVAGSANVGALSATSVNLSGGVDSTSTSTGDLTLKGLGVESNIHASNVYASGYVGIGTTTPQALLELSKNTGSATISPVELRLSSTTSENDWDTTNPYARVAFYTNDPTGDAPGVMASIGAVASDATGGENTRLGFFTAEPHLERMSINRYGDVGIGTTDPQYKLDVHGTANVGAITMNSNVYAKGLHLAQVASNLVTWDSTTGDLMDSGGLISNKLAIVSEQPPAALTGDSTVVDGHGRYKVEVSSQANSINAKHQAFDKNTGSSWLSNGNYDANGNHTNSAVTLNSIQGEYIKLTLPYKTTLRHFTLACKNNSVSTVQFPTDFTLLGSNDGSSWTSLYSLSGGSTPSLAQVSTYIVNATTSYNTYAIVIEKISPNPGAYQGGFSEWRLFTETFSVDAGVVSTTAASGLDVGYTEHPVAPMTDYKTYVEGHGTYEASASGTWFNGIDARFAWKAFEFNVNPVTHWLSLQNSYASASPYGHIGAGYLVDVGGTRYNGEHLSIKLPYSITLSKCILTTSSTGYAPVDGHIFGSSDGENWYKLTTFTGLNSTSSTVNVNATTPYKHYNLLVTKINGNNGAVLIQEWRLFAEKPVTRMENVHISGELSSETLQTGYIKWPKVPLKANESEGYVASSSNDSSIAYRAFNNTISNASDVWASDSNYTNGVADGTDSFEGVDGSWIKIKLPRAIALSHFNFYNQIGGYRDRAPRTGRIFASNDDVTWTQIGSFSQLGGWVNYEPKRVDIHATQSYSSYVFLAETIVAEVGNPAYVNFAVAEIELFEAATGVGAAPTSAKLQVAGSLGMAKGSEFFAGDDVVMELPRHDRPLVKYPEVAMTAATTAGYVASASSNYAVYNYPPYEAFNGVYGTELDMWVSAIYKYLSDGTADTSNCATFNGVYGEYLSLSMPKKIKLEKIRVHSRNNSGASQPPENGRIYGSNDNSTWTQIGTYTGLNMLHNDYRTIIVNASEYYKDYTFQIEKMKQFGTATYTCIAELEYWGYEEGDTSVDVVHRSIPNKPGQQHLEVYWDANDSDSYSFADSSSVYDLSGSAVKGTITGTNGFDAEYNAWVFDGSGDYISTTSSGLGTGGSFDHSIAFWFKINRNITNNDYVVTFGEETNDNMIAVNISGNSLIHFDNWGRGVITGSIVRLGQWYHVACTHTGSATGDINNQLIYVNGIRQVTTVTGTGTLAFTSNRITIGARPGTNNSNTPAAFLDGAVANVRFYKGKVLNADQVRELYEYDAPRFGHRQNVVALHKGNLGVGVAHPTSRFEVAGADGLQEYPPRAMTGYETYIEGHGVFRASASSISSASGRDSWKAFDKTLGGFFQVAEVGYNETTGLYEGSNVLSSSSGTPYGEYHILNLPYKIQLKKFNLAPRQSSSYMSQQTPVDGQIWGSNDGQSWYNVYNYSGLTFSSLSDVVYFDVNDTLTYSQYAIIVTKNGTGAGAFGGFSIGELRYFGTPAPSGLEDGHLTLGKALTLPRVSGHPTGAETPRAESLVVHYDTTVDSVVSGSTVVDISGEENNGTLASGHSYSSTERSFVCSGSSTAITASTNISGDATVSVSMWINIDTLVITVLPFIAGTINQNNQMIWFGISDGVWKITTGGAGLVREYSSFPVVSKTWQHVVGTWSTGTSPSNMQLYIDGVQGVPSASSGSTAKTLPSNTSFNLGWYLSSTEKFDGSISNFKLWNVALTAEEVAMEYALGRTGKSLNLTDTSLCLGGTVPRAQLDVRGSAVIDGNLTIEGGVITRSDNGTIPIMGRVSNAFVSTTSSSPNILISGLLENVDINRLRTAAYGATVMMTGSSISQSGNRALGKFIMFGEISGSDTHTELAYGFYDGVYTKLAFLKFSIGSEQRSINVYQTDAKYTTGEATKYTTSTWTQSNAGSGGYGVKDLTILY
jgi:hypothetical protein